MVKPIQVMISSRCDSLIPFEGEEIKLSGLRQKLKKEIEEEHFFEGSIFNVWINDGDAEAAGADENSWEHCLSQAEDSEIFVCLYTGEAGWSLRGGDIGICHAELENALRTGRSKVCLVELPQPNEALTDKDRGFTDYIKQQNLFRGSEVKTFEDALRRVKQSIREQLLLLARRGKTASKKDQYDRGEALDWNRLSFTKRKETMEEVISKYFSKDGGEEISSEIYSYKVDEQDIAFIISAIPSALTVSEARELVGRPQLQDHTHTNTMKENNLIGPVHVIACHKGVTESQALSILGFPDAVIIKSGFGIFVADNTYKCQLAFLSDCRDSSSTRHKAQLFFDWLSLSGESSDLTNRARSRVDIISEIYKHAPK